MLVKHTEMIKMMPLMIILAGETWTSTVRSDLAITCYIAWTKHKHANKLAKLLSSGVV